MRLYFADNIFGLVDLHITFANICSATITKNWFLCLIYVVQVSTIDVHPYLLIHVGTQQSLGGSRFPPIAKGVKQN